VVQFDLDNLILDLSSFHIQMAALDHASTPFCFVIRQFLGFFPGQVHLSEFSFDDIWGYHGGSPTAVQA